jgi:multiple antibiotic resistance protein
MSDGSSVKLFAQVFVTLLVIMDPLGNVPVFLGLSAKRESRARARLAWQAVVAAGAVIALFAFFGQQILDYLNISVPAIQGSGGLLLLLVALELLTGLGSTTADESEVNAALVPLGTPLIAGPGAIAATIVFVREAHGGNQALAIIAAIGLVLVVIYLCLRFSFGLIRVLRPSGIGLLTRIFGLLLSAIAVQLIAEAVKGFVTG